MRPILHILMLVVATFLWSSCQDLYLPNPQAETPQQEYQVKSDLGCQVKETGTHRYSEANLSNAMTLCRLACNPEERVESRTGETHSPTFRGGGKAFTACRAPRSTIHKTLGGFVQRTTVPICSFASRTYYIYVLRHILR
ncbi:MAG: hypothetical protein IJV33_02380 [Bacteroidaceae bacterium]|nr:hypothetical protein [Bacteroidaceae bacterium]